ncbi:MAG: hypothetical protein AB1649_05000 [Chloroflexota bacterium]
MTDNVIILGAGASVDAGIPVLANFVDKMLEFGMRGMNGKEQLTNKDREVFEKVLQVRNQLDGYHGRASFDDHNIEDILSILSFNIMGGDDTDRDNLKWMIQGIVRTIELTCTIKHDGELNKIQEIGPEIYRYFWRKLINRFQPSNSLPSIITFNYDLVLERALFQVLINTEFGYGASISEVLRKDGLVLKYHSSLLSDYYYKLADARYTKFDDFPRDHIGKVLEPCNPTEISEPLSVELLKLHGSLNFPSEKSEAYTNPMNPSNQPFLLPPVLNKAFAGSEQKTWKVALQRLREAKNIVIVGYSLPITDIYMQYFFKAGLGPNINLNKIFVFDPVLFRDANSCREMEQRYESCFSPQLKRRIIFRPQRSNGMFESFVDLIEDRESSIFFD